MEGQRGKGLFALLHRGGQAVQRGEASLAFQAVGRLGDLGREDVAGLQLLHPLQSLSGGQYPLHLSVLHEKHIFAVIGNVLGVVLDDDDGLALLVEVPQYLIDPVGVHGVQLGDGLVQNKNVRPQRYRAGQSQQVGLAAGQLPDILLLPALQPALGQGLPSPLQVVGEGVVEAGVGRIVQHGRPHDLIFKVLIDIAHLPGQSANVGLQRVQTVDFGTSMIASCNRMRNQSIQDFAQGGLPAAVVANDCEEVPLWNG